MSRAGRRAAALCAVAVLAVPLLPRTRAASPASPAPVPAARIIDDFESATAWKPVPADGVEMKLSTDAGVHGRSLRVDFRFVKGGGYAVLHRDLSLDLPENYRFTFSLRGECRPNNLEFKLIDSTGSNVWWCNRRNLEFPLHWSEQTIKKRHISFAWGPAGGGEIRHVAAIEFAVTAGSGGEGTVWLDDLALAPLPPPGGPSPPIRAIATSERAGRLAAQAVDGDTATWWASGARDRRPYLELDLGVEREFGGIELDWVRGLHARTYVIEVATRRGAWEGVRTVVNGNGGRDWLRLPESEARWVRLRVLRPAVFGEVALRELRIMPLEWGATLESFYEAIAKESPRGSYPRGLSGEQVYWTVVGTDDGDPDKGLLSEDGALETGLGRWSIEPFLFDGGRLITWSDVHAQQALHGVVRWDAPSSELGLDVSACGLAAGQELPPALRPAPGKGARLAAHYHVRNHGATARTVSLALAIRPFQVNPPTQFLNHPGGVAPIRSLARDGRVIRVNDSLGVVSLTEPAGFGAATFDEGDIVNYLRAGRLPAMSRVVDPQALASGALEYRFKLPPYGGADVALLVPLDEPPALPVVDADDPYARQAVADCTLWRRSWDHDFSIAAGPRDGSSPFDSLLPQLDYILTSRSGAALQPGTRSYARSWIRDGALMSSALLRLGHPEEVRKYITWFAPYQYDDGKVPCCVDARGSDPVPENDSNGEFIYLVAEYHRYTGDRSLVRHTWPRVLAAANYLDSLRLTHRTFEWTAPDRRQYFGLLPPSISHEGYSAKPMHSYWDDLFALRGFKDAVYLAGVLGLRQEQARLTRIRDEFQRDLVASVKAAMAAHKIDYVPGCADLGDFDATSTTIALDPVQAEEILPRAALERTFERYWEFFRDRRDGRAPWDAFTPYELRNVGAFVRLGWRDRAQELLRFFLQYQRPPGWHQWPEVVWKGERAPHFLGDLPHAWVGSDYVRSALDMLAYTRERDSALVVGGGIVWGWIDGHAADVMRLPTLSGSLTFTMRAHGDTVSVWIKPGLRVPRGGVVVSPPARRPFRSARVDGAPATLTRDGEVVVRRVPATVTFVP